MADGEDKHNQSFILNLADGSIITDSIAPEPTLVTYKHLPELAGIIR